MTVRSAADAEAFLTRANARLLDVAVKADSAAWDQQTNLTPENEELSAEAQREMMAATMELATEAARFASAVLSDDLARQLDLIKLAVRLPAPADLEKQAELTRTVAALASRYGRGSYDGRDLDQLSRVMAESRDPDALLDAWRGWRTISSPMRAPFERYVSLGNDGARGLGYADLGELWRSGYDMPPDAFAAEVERLWLQVKPLYDSLHAFVRRGLVRTYGAAAANADGLIAAHLLGNMWSDYWGDIYPLLGGPSNPAARDLTTQIRAKGVDAVEMVRYAERFFTSLGFESLPASFWERSMFSKPADREVICHPTSWDVDRNMDVRMSYCVEMTGDGFFTIHHELGHAYYDLAYRERPYLFRDGANAGFHEAIGDAITLSVTPDYLVEAGLLHATDGEGDDVPVLLRTALDRVPYLPFAMAVETWRWGVFSGQIKAADYNAAWWDLAQRYQGIYSPVPRSETDFDAAAKYHVAANVPSIPYFIATILQFQFHRAFARDAGFTGPLHRFSVHGNKAVGSKFRDMLALGRSRPWPEALFALTGEREMDATALLEYFAPLKRWLDEQNSGRAVGF